MNPAHIAVEPGSHTLSEILSQPECWRESLGRLAKSEALQHAARMARSGAEWTFVGCGTSYYLAIAAASAFQSLGLRARAVPASEILLNPTLALGSGRDFIPVMISRSGRTSEAVRAAQLLEREWDMRAVAITCTDGEPLEAACSITLKLPDADEHSMVMTRSFTSMLLGLQYLGATVSGNDQFRRALLELPAQAAPLFRDYPKLVQSFVDRSSFEDCVFLGQGLLFGIASECMLKVTESSSTYAQVFHSLEFRHGPKSIAGPNTMITFLISEISYDAEVELLEEMKKLGATIAAIANRIDDRVRRSADFIIELGLQVPEPVRPAAYVMWGQLYGVYSGLKKGLNPDAPRNLSRVVMLD